MSTRLNILYTDYKTNKTRSTTLIPPGIIVMWTGDIIPEGWALCDGTNGTPNLINKFIKGGIPRPLDPSKRVNLINIPIRGDTGGRSNVTLTPENLPSHNHNALFSSSSDAPKHNHTNIKNEEDVNRSKVTHKHDYTTYVNTVSIDDWSALDGDSFGGFVINPIKAETDTKTHYHTFNIANSPYHSHDCILDIDSRPLMPSPSPPSLSPPPPPPPPSSTSPSPSTSPQPPSQPNSQPPHRIVRPFNIEPLYYVLAFIMKL